ERQGGKDRQLTVDRRVVEGRGLELLGNPATRSDVENVLKVQGRGTVGEAVQEMDRLLVARPAHRGDRKRFDAWSGCEGPRRTSEGEQEGAGGGEPRHQVHEHRQ